ncbi:MAG: bifunctional riboflavin kinase/FAD synthetase [Bacteroidales bacterium]|nr:bifunctional riboflavin kinase/FAD synthetase [Bacteroidales bacterium]
MKIYRELNNIKIKKSVVTIGVFDGVHIGHKYVLKELLKIAKEKNLESVALTLWPHPRYVLNKDASKLQLLNTLDEKQKLIGDIGVNNLVVVPFTEEFASLSSCEFIKQYLVDKLKVKELIIGFDHHFGKNRQGGISELEYCAKKYGFEINRLSVKEIDKNSVSSTKIRNSLLDGDIEIANDYLGYNYFVSGIVVAGHKIGREIDFPTANIKLNNDYKIIPGDGVYAVKVYVNDHKYIGMLNIGYRPTVNKENIERCIEVNIFDFQGDIYSEEIRIEFCKKFRKEKKFSSIEMLKQQIHLDKKIIQDFFKRK